MVNYKVRSFYEKDTGTAGADVIIYDDSGDVVDTLLITTESTYNDLKDQLEGIDEKYLDRSDVLEILQNTTEIVEINATLLNGHSSDYYATNTHNHDTIYAPLSHVDILSSDSKVGHVKIINNVSSGSFREGEALAAYQGKVLQDNINGKSDSSHGHTGWTSVSSGISGIGLYVNTAIRLVMITINKSDVNFSSSTKVLGTLSNYKPKHAIVFQMYHPYVEVLVETDGKVTARSSTYGSGKKYDAWGAGMYAY